MANSNFNIVTWAGTNASKSITGVGFQPDLVWIKQYDGVVNWAVYDSGRGAQKLWPINTTSAQSTDANGLTSFDADGFTVGTTHSATSANYVAFCWKSGSAQFYLSNYTGNGTNTRLISHSLGVLPGFIISKDVGQSFDTLNNGVAPTMPNTTGYFMNTGAANAGNSFVSGASTSTTQYNPAQTAYNNNNASTTCLDYLFGALASYSAQGNYSGNGSASGPTVTLGFKPDFLLIKIVATGGWFIVNSVRSPSNTVTTSLQLNSTRAENTSDVSIDLNSTGFQIKSATLLNTSGTNNYFYAAFSLNNTVVDPFFTQQVFM